MIGSGSWQIHHTETYGPCSLKTRCVNVSLSLFTDNCASWNLYDCSKSDTLSPFIPALQADRVQSRQRGHQVQLLHPQSRPATILWFAGQRRAHSVLLPQDVHSEAGGPHPPRLYLLLPEEIQPRQALREYRCVHVPSPLWMCTDRALTSPCLSSLCRRTW